jgi:hypothetical protein
MALTQYVDLVNELAWLVHTRGPFALSILEVNLCESECDLRGAVVR